MTKQYGFLFIAARCIECRSCEIACKSENNLPPLRLGEGGPKWRGVIRIGPKEVDGKLHMSFVSLSCLHCARPACEVVCPAGAISKRSEDGIVVVDENKCIGCRYCAMACPFGAPQFGEDGRMQKCNYCLERTAKGLATACAAVCPGGALFSGTLEELSELAREKAANLLTVSTQPSLFIEK